MKKRIISGVAAMSLALATFVSFGITANATTYTASTYNSSKPVGAKSVNQGDIFEKGAYIKQDGGGRNWYVTDARSILFLTYANNPTYTGTSETRNDLTVQVKGNDRYKYWKVTKKESNYIQDGLNNRYDYSITLSPNDPSYNAPTAKSPTYNGNAQALANAATSVSGCTVKYSTDNSNWSTSVPQGTNAGKYTVYYKVEHSNYFNNLDKTASVTVTINKAASTYTTEPAAKTLTWTGEAQELVTVGTATGGKVQYKLGDGDWSENIPTATAVGTYTVYYKVVGDENHNDIAEASVTATIEDKAATATYENVGNVSGAGYDGEASAWAVTVEPGSTAIESIDVRVNDQKTSEEGAWTDTVLFGGSVTFGVAVDAAADKINSIKAVVNGSDIETTLID